MPKGFEKGHKQMGGIKKGQKQRKTILKENLGLVTIEQLGQKAYEILYEAQKGSIILSNKEPLKVNVAKTIAKIVTPQKREISGELKQEIIVNIKY